MKTKLIISLLIIGLATACGTKKNNLSAAYEVATETQTEIQTETNDTTTAKIATEQAMSDDYVRENILQK